MSAESLKEAIKRELPALLREDPAFRDFVLDLTRQEYAPRRQTENWFHEAIAELRHDREVQTRKWEEQKAERECDQAEQAKKWEENRAERERDREEQAKKWEENRAERERDREEQAKKWEEHHAERERDREEQAKKWEENRAERERDREEQAKKWEEHRAERERDREEQAKKWEENRAERERDREEQAKKWEEHRAERERDREEQAKKWEEQRAERERDREEQAKKWEENNQHFDRVHEEIMAQAKKVDRGIGALGARWGTQSEAAFRNALAGILEQNFGVQVLNVNEFDDEGSVFGRPDQIELDVIIQNGLLLICELKSSIDKAGMYIFERKARFYEARHGRKAQRLIVISPMIDARARKVAEQLGIELYTDSEDVENLDASEREA